MASIFTKQGMKVEKIIQSYKGVYDHNMHLREKLYGSDIDEISVPDDLQRARVLLVEDDRTTRRMVTRALGPYCHLLKAGSAGSAAAKYINFVPDIVFLDLELPDNNGHNVLEWMMYNDPQTHVVLFSGNCDDYNVQRALKNGAKGYVPKPFDPNLMMHFINNCPRHY